MVLFHIGFVNICCFIFVIVIRIQSWISFIEWNSIKLKYLLNLNVFMNIYEKKCNSSYYCNFAHACMR